MLLRAVLFAGLPLLFLACDTAPAAPPDLTPLSQLPLIPLPAAVDDAPGAFFVAAPPSPRPAEPGSTTPLADRLRAHYADAEDRIAFRLDAAAHPTAEAYAIAVSPTGIEVTAADEDGLRHADQTLAQLLHFATKDGDGGTFLPAGRITDAPRFAYRGYMLDVARHFFGPDTVRQVIDRLAPYKINHLHLHLSDDQGWRIEIKSWPELTGIGAATEVDGTYGGFYTQEDYAELVAYAADRGITIVPEIDMPGHTNAALSAYAELNADGVAREPYTGTEVGFSTFDANKDVTYRFVDDVVREIAALTPGPYFHLGGDESHVTAHEDYVKFINEVQKIVASHGKRSVGWDEIASAQLEAGSVVQLWAHPENALAAQRAGNAVLVSPATRTYLDMQYDTTSRIGLHWAAYIPVDSAYIWDPAAFAPGLTDDDILGIEAPLWGETIRDLTDIDYLTFPRLPALAEVGWTPQERREWTDFRRRLIAHQAWLRARGIETYDSPLLRE